MRGLAARVALVWLLAATACSTVVENAVLATETDVQDAEPVEVEARFSGNEHFSDRALFLAIRTDLLNLSRGHRREAAASDAAAMVAAEYRGAGFPDVEVTAEADDPVAREGLPDLVVVRFEIIEGPRVTVRDLTIRGVETLSIEEDLLPLWNRTLSGTLGLGDPLFVAADLRAFAATIQTRYRQEGRLETGVQGPEIERDEDAPTVTVEYTVVEGALFHFGTIYVPDSIRERLGEDFPEPPEGEVFTTRRLQEYLARVRSMLRERGHPDPVVKIEPPTRRPDATMEVVVVGEPGPRARIGSIEVVGNDRTDPDYVLSKCPFEEGQWFDGSAIEDALTGLYRTRLFSRVNIETGAVEDGEVPVTVRLAEVEPYSVELLAGYGSYERFRGGVRVADRNFLGQGWRLDGGGRISQKGYEIDSGFTDQDLFGSVLAGNVRTSYFRREQPSYVDEAFKTTTALSTALLPSLDGRLGYELIERTDVDVDVLDPAVAIGEFREARFFLELHHDTRNSALLPTQGRSISLQLDTEDDAWGSDVEFNRVRLYATQHLRLTRGSRLTLRAGTGALWPEDSSDEIPIQVRFFNGGENLVRSYREDRLGPKDSAGAPIGGEFRNVFSIEYRQRLVGMLEGALFGDAGNVGSNVQDYGLDDMGYALGFGLRLVLPIGPVRVDAAWNPNRELGEKEWVVHFSLGYPF